MKILLIQLSDIHIKGPEDHILGKIEKIASSVRNLEYDLDACFLVISGDTAFSGSDEQYMLALDFVAELRDSLSKNLETPRGVDCIVVVPGNHDCDFLGPTEVRDAIIATIDRDPNHAVSDDYAEVCTSVQQNCLSYVEAVDDGDHLKKDNDLYYEYVFVSGPSKILFRCYNTAWMSKLHEEPSHLFFPVDDLAVEREGFDLVVSVFHHPYNWLNPENAKAFSRHVENSSDIILTGHEHTPTRYTRSTVVETNEYVEGGVLQEHTEPGVSNFNALVLDVNRKKQRFYHLVWDGEIYQASSGPEDEWEDFQANRLLARREFELNENFESVLEDQEAKLTHGTRGPLRLSDVFVYPDLREVTEKGDSSQLIKGDEVFDRVLEQRNLVIAGPEKSGRTSLAKSLFKEFRAKGFVPVLIDGAALRAEYDDRLYKSIYKLFEHQYSAERVEKYWQLEKSRKVLIVDNFDSIGVGKKVSQSMGLNKRGKEQIYSLLKRFSEHVVLFVDDLAWQIGGMVEGEASGDSPAAIPLYRIQEFGHAKRDALIEKWFLPESNYTDTEAALAHQVKEVHRTLNTVLGKNFVPSFPVFVLSVLQAQEEDRELDTRASTYGYFYEIFIKNRLAAMSRRVSYDTKNAYLAFLAMHMFLEDAQDLSREELKEVHRRYEALYDLELQFENLLGELVAADILGTTGTAYKFKYKYMYYYFAASYIQNHIHLPEVKEHISTMSERLWVEEYANILLFLAHLSKDPFIVEQMLAKARSLYEEHLPADLERDVSFINDISKAAYEAVYYECDTETSRKESLERMDEAEQEDATQEEEDDLEFDDPSEAEAEPMVRLMIAFKSMQIVGQILKNFYGSIEGDRKAEIAKECYQLGLRSLREVFELIEEHREDFLQVVVEELRSEHPHEPREELVKRASKTIAGMAHVISYGFVRRISHSVGHYELALTYRRVLEEEGSVAVALVDASIKLDHNVDFPEREILRLGEQLEDNLFAVSLLRHLVVNHFYMFPIGTAVKQRVCQKLGIPISQAKPIFSGRKKIAN